MKSKERIKGLGRGAPMVSRNGMRKMKSYRLGYKAAKKGLPTTACPYKLTEEMVAILVKRDRWMHGHEDFAFTPKGSRAQHKRITRERKEKLKKKEKR